MYDLGPYIVFHHSSASAYYEEQEMGKAWKRRLSYTVDGLLVVCILVWLTTLPSMILSFLPILSVLQGTIQKLVNKIVGSHPFIQNFSLQH